MKQKTHQSEWDKPLSPEFKFFYEELTELEDSSVLVTVDSQEDFDEALFQQELNPSTISSKNIVTLRFFVAESTKKARELLAAHEKLT
jgi:hypothetical protein